MLIWDIILVECDLGLIKYLLFKNLKSKKFSCKSFSQRVVYRNTRQKEWKENQLSQKTETYKENQLVHIDEDSLASEPHVYFEKVVERVWIEFILMFKLQTKLRKISQCFTMMSKSQRKIQ